MIVHPCLKKVISQYERKTVVAELERLREFSTKTVLNVAKAKIVSALMLNNFLMLKILMRDVKNLNLKQTKMSICKYSQT